MAAGSLGQEGLRTLPRERRVVHTSAAPFLTSPFPVQSSEIPSHHPLLGIFFLREDEMTLHWFGNSKTDQE